MTLFQASELLYFTQISGNPRNGNDCNMVCSLEMIGNAWQVPPPSQFWALQVSCYQKHPRISGACQQERA